MKKQTVVSAAQRWLALLTVLLALCVLPQAALADEAPAIVAQAGEVSFVSGLPSTTSNTSDTYVTAKYSDEYFMKDASVYNSDLAYSSLCLAASTMNSNRFGDDYSKKSVNVQSFLHNVGCRDITVNVGYTTRPMEQSNIGVAIGHKSLPFDNAELFVVGIRGGNYQAEWAGNVRVGRSGFHQGFAEARDSVLAFILPYIKEHAGGRTVKVWISGYSRSGAVSNLVGGWLDSWLEDREVAGVSPTVECAEGYSKNIMRNTKSRTYDLTGVKMSAKNIYCYPVNAPQGATPDAVSKSRAYCKGIHNLINADDWIPQVAPYINDIRGFQFARYGVDHDLTGTFTDVETNVPRESWLLGWNLRNSSVWQRHSAFPTFNYVTMNRFLSITGKQAIPWRFRQFFFSKTQFTLPRYSIKGIELIISKFKQKKGEKYSVIFDYDSSGTGNRYSPLAKGQELQDKQGQYFDEFIRFFVDACGVRSRDDYVDKLQGSLEYLMDEFMGNTKSDSDRFNAKLRLNITKFTEKQSLSNFGKVAYALLGGLVNKTANYGAPGLLFFGYPLMRAYMSESQVHSVTTQAIDATYEEMGKPYNADETHRTLQTVTNIVGGIFDKEQSIGSLNFYHIATLLNSVDTIGQAHMPELAISWHDKAQPGSFANFNAYLDGAVIKGMSDEAVVGLSDSASVGKKTVMLYRNEKDDYVPRDNELIARFTIDEADDLVISPDTYEIAGMEKQYTQAQEAYKGYYEAPDRRGYLHCGWATGPESDENRVTYWVDDVIDYEEIEGISGSVVNLFAEWLDDAQWLETYHANRYAGDNESVDELDYADGDKLDIADNEFTNSGYVFAGWNTKADGTGIALQPQATISLSAAGLTSRAEMHKRLDQGVDEDAPNAEALLQQYADEATLHLYAQWTRSGGGQQGGSTTPGYQRHGASGAYAGTWSSSGGSGDSTTTSATPAVTGSKPVSRLSDTNRYGTMAYVSAAVADSSDWVIVVSGENFPDALCASALAGAHHAPIILTEPGALTAEAQGQIERLGPSHVIIVGGDAAVSAAVEASLGSMVADVTRVSGADRAATSVEGLRATRAANASSATVIVATGASFADALSAGAWAWATSSPVVLAGGNGLLTASEVEAIRADAGISRVVILGGTGAVSDGVMQQLGDGYEYVRLGGADRYETSSKIAEWATANGLGWTRPVVATGRGFADALCGSALAGTYQSPILLVDSSASSTMETLRSHSASVSGAFILGGTSAIPQAIADAVSGVIG